MSRLGLEPPDASGMDDNDLRQSSQEGAAKSGAVPADLPTLTPEALATALLALPPADRARLAALLVETQQQGKTSESPENCPEVQ